MSEPEISGQKPLLTEPQILLLKAALISEKKKAAENFESWKNEIDFEALDGFSYLLLPKLYLNLQANEFVPKSDLLLPRIRGVYRKTWLENQLKMRQVAEVFNLLANCGIEFIVTNFEPLLLKIFQDESSFPFDNFSILIKSSQVASIFKALQANGWNSPDIPRNRFPKNRSIFMQKPENKISVEVFWTPSNSFQSVLDRAAEAEFAGAEIKILPVEEQILRLCEKEFTSLRREEGRWAIAATVLQNENQAINWETIIVQSQKREISLEMWRMLKFLSETSLSKVPEQVLYRLQKAPPPPKIFSLIKWRKAAATYHSLKRNYGKNAESSGDKTSLTGFAKFLCIHWSVNSVFGLPKEIASRFRKLYKMNS